MGVFPGEHNIINYLGRHRLLPCYRRKHLALYAFSSANLLQTASATMGCNDGCIWSTVPGTRRAANGSTLPALIGVDESPAGYSLAGCSPAWPASASPAWIRMR
jgi:hypothetical protein